MPATRRNVVFDSKGTRCSTFFYLPERAQPGERCPAIVMAHGVASTKEMRLPAFAELFANAGFVVILFDYRNPCASGGEPCNQMLPVEQHEDDRNAITWTQLQYEVDHDRVGLWGTSYRTRHLLHPSAFDRRAKAVVAKAPVVSAYQTARRLMPPIAFTATHQMVSDDRVRRYQTGEICYLPVAAPEGEPRLLTTPDSLAWLSDASSASEGRFENRISIESVEHFFQLRASDPHRRDCANPIAHGRRRQRSAGADRPSARRLRKGDGGEVACLEPSIEYNPLQKGYVI
jgi:uncharacterized protein